jgi:uncharacterized protein (DUF58 family)
MRIPLVSLFSSIIPSRRLIVYFALGSLLWVGALLARELVVAAQLYLLVLAFVALLDVILSPQPQDFEVERHVPDKMNLGTANKVNLEARSRAARMPDTPMPLTLRDEPPLDWPVTLLEGGEPVRAPVEALRALPVVARLTVGLLPRRAALGEYSVIPTRRGVWRFGAISGRYQTRLGFWHRQFRREAEQEVRVYPIRLKCAATNCCCIKTACANWVCTRRDCVDAARSSSRCASTRRTTTTKTSTGKRARGAAS